MATTTVPLTVPRAQAGEASNRVTTRGSLVVWSQTTETTAVSSTPEVSSLHKPCTTPGQDIRSLAAVLTVTRVTLSPHEDPGTIPWQHVHRLCRITRKRRGIARRHASNTTTGALLSSCGRLWRHLLDADSASATSYQIWRLGIRTNFEALRDGWRRLQGQVLDSVLAAAGGDCRVGASPTTKPG